MKKAILICIAAALICALAVFSINFAVVLSTAADISAEPTVDADCILVLGCGILPDGTPTAMLKDRLLTAISLYNAGYADILLMSGDNGRVNYDEVSAMKAFAMAEGVPESSIVLDHAGFSTYESVYRARDIFCVEKVIIVTQKYHLHRALYIANALGVEAQGVSADLRGYSGQIFREIREILARNKDFVQCIFKPLPTFLGEKLPINE